MRQPVSDDLVEDAEAPLLEVAWTCNRCSRKAKGAFAWACLAPDRNADATWDGVVLSRIVTCKKCGAVDDYTLSPDSMMRFVAGMISRAAGGKPLDRLRFEIFELWDGTRLRRPSQGLARLRQIVSEQPKSAEAHRRLGNLCERFGLIDEAVASWTRAVELDDGEVEASYSLTRHWGGPGRRAALAFTFLRRSVQALPEAIRRDPEQRRYARAVASLLQEVVENTRAPIALMAGWTNGERHGQAMVSMSSIDLRKVESFDRLADFLSSKAVIGLDLTGDLPEDEPTILQQLLAGEPFETTGERQTSFGASQALPTCSASCRQ